jgi:gliding-associated putative ABC transporter substrate-binding component GldG
MNKSNLSIALVLAIIIFVNLVSEQYFLRFDLTEDKQFTLSEATKNILENIEEPITVTAYFSEDLPTDVARTKSDFEDLLVEYNRLSGDNILFTFINPNESEATEQQAQQAGVQPVLVNVREKDQVKQQRAYLGAVLEWDEQKEVIPFMQPGAALEYALSTAIKKMTVLDKAAIGLLQGHGEPTIEELLQVENALSVLYDVEPLTITDSTAIPNSYKTIAIVNPTDSLSSTELSKLDAYLEAGGNLFIALNRVEGKLQEGRGIVQNTGLEGWLKEKGIEVESAFLIDANSGSITVQQQQGQFRFNTNVPFPYLPIISNFPDHPITKGLEAMVLQFASPIRASLPEDTTLRFIPLATTSEVSGKKSAPLSFDIQKQWNKSDFPQPNQVAAALLEKSSGVDNPWKIIVVGDGDFPINGPRGNQKQLQPDQVNFMVNSVDWLSDDSGLIDLRTKGISYRPIDNLEDATKASLKYLNFFLPLVLLALYGIIRSQRNRIKRAKRMEEDYV